MCNFIWRILLTLFLVTITAYSQDNFKIENTLNKAIASAKSNNKFLVVYADNKKNAKNSFDIFIEEKKDRANHLYDGSKSEFDFFSFYLAGTDDEVWLKNNKFSNPSIIILNGDADILAIAKSDLLTKKSRFTEYGGLYEALHNADAFASIGKTLRDKKATDTDLIKTFNKSLTVKTPYSYNSYTTNSDAFIIRENLVNRTDVELAWQKLIETHQNDVKPNMYLAETILSEINNVGFTQQLFNQSLWDYGKDKIWNDTDVLSIDYLLQHIDEIEKNRDTFNTKEGEIYHYIDNVVYDISLALRLKVYSTQKKSPDEIEKVIAVYKKLIALGKANFELYYVYFDALQLYNDKDGSNSTFLNEFKTYFDSYLVTKDPIKKLEETYLALNASESTYYNEWDSFVKYHSNLCNAASWIVAEKPQNFNFIKDAIKWSECSSLLSKNNPYYLDTLAQLYYKDGQKQKAIETQKLAVKYINANIDDKTAADIKNVLSKMVNGTY